MNVWMELEWYESKQAVDRLVTREWRSGLVQYENFKPALLHHLWLV